jgi:hypothetical protein
MNGTEDRVTVVFVNGEVSEVSSTDPSRVSDLTLQDYEYISKAGTQILAITPCRLHADGKCYYYIGTKKVKCTCP